LVIGSDQVASSEGRPLGKPGNHARATEQLRSLSGKSADFHTAVSLLDSRNNETQSRVVLCRVVFRKLDDETVERYLRREHPYDCAGSAKAEGLGIALIARIETEDPTSLIGLPLIALTEMLERAGMPVICFSTRFRRRSAATRRMRSPRLPFAPAPRPNPGENQMPGMPARSSISVS